MSRAPQTGGSDALARRESLAVLAVIIVLTTFGARASNNVIATSLPLLVKDYFKFNSIEVGLVATAFMGSTFVSSTFINARLPPRTRRKFFITGAVLYAVAFPFFSLSSPLTVWLLAAIAGIALGPIMPNIMTSAGSVGDVRQRERLLGLYTLALSTSLLIGPTIDFAVTKYFGLKNSYIYLEPLAALVAIMSPFLKFPDEGPRDGRRPKISTAKILTNSGFIAASLNNLTYSVPFAFINTYNGIYAEQKFLVTPAVAILLYSIFYVTSFLGRLMLTIRTPGNLVRYMILSSGLTIVGLVLAWLSPTLWLYVIALLVLGIPHGFTYTLSVISISRTFEPSQLNAANSYFFSIMMLIGAGLPAGLGLMVLYAGIKNTIILIVPIVLVIFLATLVFASRASSKLIR